MEEPQSFLAEQKQVNFLLENAIFSFDAPVSEAYTPLTTPAQVAELVDALASGASVRMDVEVRVLSWAPKSPFRL